MKKAVFVFGGLFVFYCAICIYTLKNPLENDECRYLGYAHNLTKGYYAPQGTLMLWNGPGYPLVLYPLVKMGLPDWAGKCLNPIFLLAGVVFLYRLLRLYIDRSKAMLGAFLFGLYPPLLPDMIRLLTEPLTICLVCGFCYFSANGFRKKKATPLLLAGLFGGLLILTKVLFAHVLTGGLLLTAIWMVVKKKGELWRFALICGLSLLFCTPYLYYTWSLTGRHFYWSNAGGSLLYWISDPCKDHWGDWHNENETIPDPRYIAHKPLYEKLSKMDFVQQDDLFKQEAVKNLKAHPAKFLFNCFANAGRLWLSYPYTYKVPRPQSLFYMIPNAVLLGGLVFCIYPLLRAFSRIDDEIIFVLIIVMLYIGLSTVLPANARYLVPMVPLFVLLLSYTGWKLLDIRIREIDPQTMRD